MALNTIIPTANESPDTGQGTAGAVSTPTNTGHGSTLVSAPGGIGFKTCRWSGFPSFTGNIVSITLKATWTVTGFIEGVQADNRFEIMYSSNGGGAWNSGVLRASVTSPDSGTMSISLALSQDTSQVQVRDSLEATSNGVISATLTASVSDIKIEIQTTDGNVIVVM